MTMEAYTGFAEVYDLFMDNIPYEDWCTYLTGLLREYGVENGLVLDLACGTGTLTRLLAEKGYDMIGVDASADMLEIAMEKQTPAGELQTPAGEAQTPTGEPQIPAGEAKTPTREPQTSAGEQEAKLPQILYLQQDMREFELYGTVRAVVCICDSMNYLLEYEDLVQVFRLANNYLDPGGVFIFDLNTPYKYREILGEQTIAENREEGSFIWENFYDEETQVNEYDLTLFVREAENCYRKYEETHYQRAFEPELVKRAIAEAGMEFVASYDAFTHDAPHEKSERIYMIARERGK